MDQIKVDFSSLLAWEKVFQSGTLVTQKFLAVTAMDSKICLCTQLIEFLILLILCGIQ
jgi:hypothetical protein